MIIKGYGVQLTRLTENDIEQVRVWRNSEMIRQFMEYREEITPEMQKKWFDSINNESNNHYIIQDQDKKIGLIYGADVDWDKRETGNGGIFIADENYWNTNIPIATTFLVIEISFMLGFKKNYIKIIKDNHRAIEFNKNFGYEILDGQEDVYNQKYVQTEESYKRNSKKIQEFLNQLHGDKIEIFITDTSNKASKIAMEEYKIRYAKVKDRVSMYLNGKQLTHE